MRKIRDAKLQNSRRLRQETLATPKQKTIVKKNCLTCANKEIEDDYIHCHTNNWYMKKNIARVASCTVWESDEP